MKDRENATGPNRRFRIKRRLTFLTLARAEWEELVLGVATLPDSSSAYTRTLAFLRQRLAHCSLSGDELLTIALPPLAWSSLIFGLSAFVLRSDALRSTAERVRAQLSAQSRAIEGRIPSEQTAQLALWREPPRPRASEIGLN